MSGSLENAELNRLTADDDLFWKVHRLFGNVLVIQLAWQFEQALDLAVLEQFHRHLAHGFLARRVCTTRVPFARPWWAPALRTIPLQVESEPVPDEAVLDWFTARAEVDFDPTDGRVWQLSTAPTVSGGTVLVLTIAHVAADGSGGLCAVTDALAATARGETPDRMRGSGRLVGASPDQGLLRAHLRDARGQLRAIATGIRSAFAARKTSIDVPRTPRPEEPRLELPESFSPADLALTIPLRRWTAVASAHGGTANGLMLAIAVGILGRSGRVTDGELVRVEIPRSMREPEDPRANATTGVAIAVPYSKGSLVDPASIRELTKQAMTAYDDPTTTPVLQHLQPLQLILPDFLVRRFVRTSKAPVCLCTNLGETAGAVAEVGGIRARRVLMRPVVCRSDTETFRRTEIGLSLSWASDGSDVTLGVIGADPDRFPTRAVLRGYVEAELTTWGLEPEFW